MTSIEEMTNEEKLTQRERIITYVDKKGTIDRITALGDCGIFELSARIGEIEKHNPDIKFNRKRKKGISKMFGTPFSYTEYSFDRENTRPEAIVKEVDKITERYKRYFLEKIEG